MLGKEKLRDEIMALHAAHRDLTRWKLIAVGVVGALGLGVSAPTGSGFNLAVLSLAPLLAAYCDLLLREYDLRVAIIAAFLRKEGSAFAKYEAFINAPPVASTAWWRFSMAATLAPSLATCILTAAAGIFLPSLSGTPATDLLVRKTTLASAGLGLILVLWIEFLFRAKQRPLLKVATVGPNVAGTGS